MSHDADRLAMESFAFLVEFAGAPGGIVSAGFQACVLGPSAADTVDFRKAGGAATKPPGLHQGSDVILRRGLAPAPGLADWARTPAAEGRTVTIRLRDESRAIVQSWELHGVRVTGLVGLPAPDGRTLAIEELTLHVEALSPLVSQDSRLEE